MQVIRITRVARVSIAVITVSVFLPLTLSSCASAAPSEPLTAELHTAHDSDLLSVATDKVFEVSKFEFTGPNELAKQAGVVSSSIDLTGFMVLNDGLITAAEFGIPLAEAEQVSYVLTEPTAIRRSESENGPVYAVGEMTVGSFGPHAATMKLTPSFLSEGSVSFDVDFLVPEEISAMHPALSGELVSAKISLIPAE